MKTETNVGVGGGCGDNAADHLQLCTAKMDRCCCQLDRHWLHVAVWAGSASRKCRVLHLWHLGTVIHLAVPVLNLYVHTLFIQELRAQWAWRGGRFVVHFQHSFQSSFEHKENVSSSHPRSKPTILTFPSSSRTHSLTFHPLYPLPPLPTRSP